MKLNSLGCLKCTDCITGLVVKHLCAVMNGAFEAHMSERCYVAGLRGFVSRLVSYFSTLVFFQSSHI